MHIIARPSADHAVVGRTLADKILQARAPALIDLPHPLPSIPVLTPLLSPVIAGSKKNSGSGTTTTTTSASVPAQTSSSTGSSSGNKGGSSGGNKGGNSSGNSGGSTSGSTGSTGGSTDGSSSGSSGSSGGSSSSGSSTGSDTTGSNTGSSSSGGTSSSNTPSTGNTGADTSPSSGNSPATGGPTTGSQGTDNPTSGHGGPSGGVGASPGSGPVGAHSGNFSAGGGGITGPGLNAPGIANAGSIPSVSQGGSLLLAPTIGTGSSGSQSVTGGLTSSTNSAGGGNNSGTGDDPHTLEASSKGGLSGGAIAGIVICILLLLIGLVVFVLRRRSRVRRSEQANRWWFTRKRTSQTYGDRHSQEIPGTGAHSARSSFATTFDHSHSLCAGGFGIPPLPPMAEIGRDKATAPMLVLDPSHFNVNPDSRLSVGSVQSDDSQYLVVHHRHSINPETPTPMSVRPFSPSEMFAFPKPPEIASVRTSPNSRPNSSALSTSGTFATAKGVDDVIPPTPALPELCASKFPGNSDPFADNNPFEDPAAAAVDNRSAGEFAETEIIRRRFDPTLPDELMVRPDDAVHFIQSFDDGWALVEKVDVKGKGREDAEPERGLIPVDCLREPGVDLPAFYAAKRMSSYTGSSH